MCQVGDWDLRSGDEAWDRGHNLLWDIRGEGGEVGDWDLSCGDECWDGSYKIIVRYQRWEV
jgi:hypothetical protein